MALTKCTVPDNVIGSLGTTVQERGLTTQQFKDKFDQMPEGIKEYINNVLTEELDAHIADYMSHKAEMATDTHAGHIKADSYVKLWEGNTATPGEYTALSSMHNKFDAFIIASGNGPSLTYCYVENPVQKFNIFDPSNGLNYFTYNGVGHITGVDPTGTKFNLVDAGGQNLRWIYGIIKYK